METKKSNKKFLVYDSGLYLELAKGLAKGGNSVKYYTPYQASFFPKYADFCIGKGFEGIEKIKYFFDAIDEADVICVFDVGNNDIVSFLRKHFPNKAVWGSGKGQKLEDGRWGLKKIISSLGLPVQRGIKLKGVHALSNYLLKNPDKFVKVDIFRGTINSFHAKDYKSVELLIEYLEHALGAFSEDFEFIVEDAIKTSQEWGVDTFYGGGDYTDNSYYGVELGKDCYDNQTEVLTDKGWKFFKDLDKTEKVATLNIDNPRYYSIEYNKPDNYIEYDYNGEMVSINSQQINLLVKPKHNLFIRETYSDSSKKFVLKEAEQCIPPFSIPNIKPQYCGEGDRAGIYIGDIYINKEVWAEFMGMFLSEGYVRPDRNEIIIAQEKFPDEFEEKLKRFPIPYKRIKTGFYLCHKELAEELRKYGKSGDKYVPDIIKQSSHHIIRKFLYMYLRGDGTIRKCGTWIYYTKSKKMADDLQELLLKIGSVACIYPPANGRNIYIIKERKFRTKNTIQPKHYSKVNYTGKVYCLEVKNHIIYVRRNGKPTWCGNCYIGKLVPTNELPKPLKETMMKFKPVLSQLDWRGCISTEEKIVSEKEHYFLDICARSPNPSGLLYPEMIENWSEMVATIASNKPAKLVSKYKYVGCVPLYSKHTRKSDTQINFDPKYLPNVKFMTAYKKGEHYYAIKDSPEELVATVVAGADTVDNLIKKLKEVVAEVDCYEIDKNASGELDTIKDIISDAKKINIVF